MTAHFDAIVIGAGQAGPPLAARLSVVGMNVAIIERKHSAAHALTPAAFQPKLW